MARMRSLITLTLAGMMAVALIFPAGIQAEDECGTWDVTPPADLMAADGFDPSPEFTWTDVSGATTYTIEVAEDSGFATIAQTGTLDATNCADDTCSWTPDNDLDIGDFYWRVSGTGECLKDPENPTPFDIPASEAEVSVMGVTASLTSRATDPIREGSPVPVDVSLANLGFEVVDVTFSVTYDTGKFDTPTEEDIVLGLTGFTAGDITDFDATTTPGTVTVTITGGDTKLIPENAGILATLNFTVKENPTLGDASPPFTITIDDITAKMGDENVEIPGTAAQSGTQAAVTVSPQAGDADGIDGLTLKDVLIFLEVAAGATSVDLGPGVTVYAGADVNGDGVVGVPEAAFVMDELAK